MNFVSVSRIRKSALFLTTFLMMLTISATAFAAGGAEAIEDPAADTTNTVIQTQTQYRWFYWPGWAFAGLTFVVLCLVAFFYYKNVLGPKYRGRKVKA